MNATPGTHELGPTSGDLLLRTTSEGKLAKMGHALTLLVERWRGQVEVGATPQECSLQVTVDLASLRVLEGHGGASPLTDAGRSTILQHAARTLGSADQPQLGFTSSTVSGSWEKGRIQGTLTLNGRREEQSFDVERVAEGYRLTGTITQSRFGIKPYSAMMGQLRVGDDVAVEVTLAL